MVFLVLLRMGIGWHFLYEGAHKIQKTSEGKSAWSAQGYLRASEGPLRDVFRGMVDDPDGLEVLNEAYLFAQWDRHALVFADRHRFDAEKRGRIDKKLRELRKVATEYLSAADGSLPIDAEQAKDEPSRARMNLYREEVADFKKAEREAKMDHQKKQVTLDRAELAKARNMLTAPVKDWTAELDTFLRSLASERDPNAEEEEAADLLASGAGGGGPTTTSKLSGFMESFQGLPWMDNVTMWGLSAVGVCLLAGLFSRAAAVGGIAFLAMIYLSRPPWPGLPANPVAEGNYWLVDKNTIEMIALLALLFIPTGRWAGLDALIHRWVIGREGRVNEDIARQQLARTG